MNKRECPNCGEIALWCEPFHFAYSCVVCGHREIGEKRFWQNKLYDANGDFISDANKILEKQKKEVFR